MPTASALSQIESTRTAWITSVTAKTNASSRGGSRNEWIAS